MNLQFHPAAKVDLQQHVTYLLENGVEGDQLKAFHSAVREALAKVERNPMTWSLASGSRRIRKVQILRFRLPVFYLTRPDEVPLILEIAGPGRQSRWRRRL
jgi:hypothetical protein